MSTAQSSHNLARLQRIARQELRTIESLGVDFIPLRAVAEAAHDKGSRVDDLAHILSDAAIAGLTSRAHKQAALDRLREAHDAACPHCTTATGHTRTVFGEGNPDADLMFIGEAPGADEDRTGRPFVGRAGQKLDEIIRAMKLEREDVYIANVLKARPPDNRTPLPDEVAGCSPYLVEQIRIIQPKVIVTLGGPATKLVLGSDAGITRLRGTWGECQLGSLNSIPVMPTFHPAYLLRNYTQDTRAKVWSDMKEVMSRLG